jgi:nitroreductase
MTAWLEAASERRSRRAFDGTPALPQTIDALSETCEGFRPFGDARVVLVAEPQVDPFKGVVGSYGKVTGAPHVLLVIAHSGSSAAQAHAGYVGEAAILEATALGLGTCWIGGFFDPKKALRLAELGPEERIVAISPVGFPSRSLTGTERTMRSMAGSHKRKTIDEIAAGTSEWAAWAKAAAECVRIAPSAVNRQPWRLRLEDGSLVVARDNKFETPKVTKALDCGIAMLHAELGALGKRVAGTWATLDDRLDVARFVPAEGSA